MKRIACLLTAFGAFTSIAQHNLSSFTTTGRGGATTFVTDYQAVGINPANLGWTWKFEDKKVALGFNEMTYSVHSEALSKQELRDEIRDIIRDKSTSNFTREEKLQAAQDFASGFAFNADYGSIGAAYTGEKFGGIAFRINDRFQWHSNLGQGASDLLFLGKTAPYFDSLIITQNLGGGNISTDTILNDPSAYNFDTLDVLSGFASTPGLMSQLLDGTNLSFNWYREYNLSYGRKVFEKDSIFALYAGVGIKYLQGLAIMEVRSENGVLDAFSAITPFFDIDYGSNALSNPSSIESGNTFLPKSVGSGYGYDLGVNVILFNRLKVGLAYVNGGSITYDGNVYTVKDTLLAQTTNDGIGSNNIFESVEDFLEEDGLLQWDGLEEKTVDLPSTIRMGASMRFGKKIELGVDVVVPGNEVPGSLDQAIIGFGGDIQPIPWLTLQTGFLTGGNYDFQVPVGILISPASGSYEFGLASRDAVTFFAKNGPTLSLSLGFLRFRF